jgi:hypothetical protein
MQPFKTYNGSCHCGAVRFRFRSEEITSGCRCNCSICIRRGVVMSSRYFTPDEFELLDGKEALTVYQSRLYRRPGPARLGDQRHQRQVVLSRCWTTCHSAPRISKAP